MPKKFIDPDTNEEVDAVPLSEHEKALADKDEHVKTKLAEFETGKNSQTLKDKERDEKIAEAERKANEAAAIAASSEAKRLATVEQFALENLTGGNPELIKKIQEALPLVNLEIKDDKDILEKYRLASNLAGLGNTVIPAFHPMGGYAPSFRQEEKISDVDHERFLKETGLK